MKMRAGETFNMDTLYKVAKMMPNHNGSPVYQGTVTVTKEYGEIRSQWNLTSDSTDQYKAPIFEMKKTMDQYGNPHPTGFMMDNPRPFENFILENFPSVQARQDHLDNIIKNHMVIVVPHPNPWQQPWEMILKLAWEDLDQQQMLLLNHCLPNI
jgi:hypothetical protein